MDGGIAGIILPVSFLTSSETINIQTRDLLYKNFKIKACVYLGEKTFMATNAFTVILFLEKRKSNELESIENLINTFFEDYKDFSFNGTNNVIEKYLQYVFKGLTLKDYKYFLVNYESDTEHNNTDNEICNEYVGENLSKGSVIKLEKQKLFHFIISYNQKIVIVDSNTGNKELDFLGYEFRGKRRSEGIKLKKNEMGDFKTKLYNGKKLLDNSRVNYYILKSFENNLPKEIHEDLTDYIEIVNFCDLFDFTNYTFDNQIRYRDSAY